MGNKLFSWGRNAKSTLGLGDATDRSTPVQVGTQTGWTRAQVGNYRIPNASVGLMNSKAYSWGYNIFGLLGINKPPNTTYNTPQQIGSNTNWTYVAAGSSHSLLINASGQMWASGHNAYGELGTNNLTQYSSPVLVSGGITWSKCFAGSSVSAGIDTSGRLWTWGYGTHGQLGQTSLAIVSSPVQVGAGTNWKQVVFGGAVGFWAHFLTTTGNLYFTGTPTAGVSGLGNSTVYSSPVIIPGTANWAQVAANVYSMGALRNDGTLWQWGAIDYGEGPPAGSNLSPVLTGSGPWKKIGGGRWHNLALRTNGTLYTWGRNNYGQLGNGNTSSLTYSNKYKIIVPGATGWSDVGVSAGSSNFALYTYTAPGGTTTQTFGLVQRQQVHTFTDWVMGR